MSKQGIPAFAGMTSGVSRGALPYWMVGIVDGKKSLLIVPEDADVWDVSAEIESLAKMPKDWHLGKPLSVGRYTAEDEATRTRALYEWLHEKIDLLVASKESLDSPADRPDQISKRSLHLKPGFTMQRTKFEEFLSQGGYMRNEWTDQIGEYSIRGDVIDLWPAGSDLPIRIVWNVDTIEALRQIDVHSQRSDIYERDVLVTPVKAGQSTTLLETIPSSTPIFFFGDSLETDRPFVHVGPHFPDVKSEGFDNPPSFAGNINLLRDTLIKWHDEDWKVVIYCHNQGESDRLEELLTDPLNAFKGTKPAWLPPILIGDMEHGFIQSDNRQAILTNSEIFGRYRKRVRLPKFESGGALASLNEIKPADYLVHEKYGIGRYAGLNTLKVGKISMEFLTLEYKGGDRIYVPIFELQQVQKYLGAEGKRPPLSSLDTAAWERIKSKVKEDVAKLAKDLLSKAAKRSIRPGIAYPQRTHLEDEFASSFLYKLTPDQVKTLEEVEADMTQTRPMDRLICGDVGFGKTEIAMRAAMKAALAGKQVALLCPTTILAEQHWRNFSERMADYPITVKLVSRFQEKSEQKKILEAAATGGVDIVIGTHRLLSKDVHFKDLGLLIIDEEHRFGVKQKSKLFGLRETVDFLSLTATPIPRTLASSLGGIKDLSVIETPPEGRLPISTHVGVFDEDLMVKAVQSELDRGGQVFYVHNRVKTLLARKEWLQSILPQVRIVMAHGQMNETELEEAMHDFLHKKVDVLLATTIIESGLDIPSVNTLIVEEAEEMGLAQLYQLRGRVGRSATRAYCYLFHQNVGLTTDAKKRLEALKEFTSLGSGLRLAMRDMEIRGAGNLLGPQQHGNIAAVGIETYGKLLTEEIQKLKGQPVDDQPEGPTLELNVSAMLPSDYVPSESERVIIYKRILSAKAENLPKIKDELVDRCGPLPPPAAALFESARLRLEAKKFGIAEIHEEEEALIVYFRKGLKIKDEAVNRMLAQPRTSLTFIPGETTGVKVFLSEGENGLQALERFLNLVFKS